MKPFTEEKLEDGVYIRTFETSVPNDELKWHWDEEDRVIEVLENADWIFQFDNQLPFPLMGTVFIPKGMFHRIIKGGGILKVKITKLQS